MQTLLDSWATTWNIPALALADLRARLVNEGRTDPAPEKPGLSEAAVSSRLVRDAAYQRPDVILWRNNVGAMQDMNGRVVRFGLANESTRQNRVVKSADFIGIRRHVVSAADVGATLGLFVSTEVKEAAWKMPATPDEHVQAQINWATLVQSYGGIASFYNGHGPLPF